MSKNQIESILAQETHNGTGLELCQGERPADSLTSSTPGETFWISSNTTTALPAVTATRGGVTPT